MTFLHMLSWHVPTYPRIRKNYVAPQCLLWRTKKWKLRLKRCVLLALIWVRNLNQNLCAWSHNTSLNSVMSRMIRQVLRTSLCVVNAIPGWHQVSVNQTDVLTVGNMKFMTMNVRKVISFRNLWGHITPITIPGNGIPIPWMISEIHSPADIANLSTTFWMTVLMRLPVHPLCGAAGTPEADLSAVVHVVVVGVLPNRKTGSSD